MPLARLSEGIVWIPSIDETGTARTQQFFHLLDCFADLARWLASVNLALQFNQSLIGSVETLCQDRRHIEKYDWVPY